MSTIEHAHDLTLWLVDDVPARMVYAGRRWRVTDMPTRLRIPSGQGGRAVTGWRFQATDPQHVSHVFDVYGSEDAWHVHRTYD